MASKTLQLKVMVDEETQKIAFAEANSTFVNTLFSLLSLPLATTIRTLRSINPSLLRLGCLHNLYQSVETLNPSHFLSPACKSMLLHPKTSDHYIGGLNFKLSAASADDSRACYICPNWRCDSSSNYAYVSLYEGTPCGSCRKEMTTRLSFEEDEKNEVSGGGRQFVDEDAVFVIAEGLKVMPSSTSAILSALEDQGITTGKSDALEERFVSFEVTQLLLMVLYSKTPLNDLILGEKVHPLDIPFKNVFLSRPKGESNTTRYLKKFQLKLIVRKSEKRVLYGEAGGDFVNLLLNFLGIPLGATVNLLGGNSHFECLNKLHKSIKNFDEDVSKIYHPGKGFLLRPNVPPFMESVYLQLLDISKDSCPELYFYERSRYFFLKHPPTVSAFRKSTNSWGGEGLKNVHVVDPRAVSADRTYRGSSGVWFVKEPAMFTVTDDLIIRPLSSTSDVLSILDGLKVPISDVEEKMVKVGETEAVNLLNASLVSNMVLTNVFKLDIYSS